MIVPSPSSPLRPIIAAFYQTSHQARPSWGKDELSQTLRAALDANGVDATSSPIEALDLVAGGRIGVVILIATRSLTDAARRSVRQVLTGDDAPELALIMAFLPTPRIARVDAPRRQPEE
jgi:hypothetical protein